MSTNFPNGLRSRGVPLPSGGIPPTGGNVFHVDSGHANASDSGPGTNPNHPMSTLDAAIALCTANNGDQIWVYPGHAETVSAAAGLDLDVAGITIIFLGNGNDRGTITFGTAVGADMDVDAADITLINPRFVAGIDALTGPIDVNAARFKMYNATYEDGTTINTTDVLVADANADDMLIDGFEFIDGDGAGTQKQSFIQIAGATRPTLKNIKCTGDFGTGIIENGTAWIDALLENIVIDNASASPTVGILLQATSTGQAVRVYVRVASGVTYITANNDMQWFDCWGAGTDADSAAPIGSGPYNVGSFPSAAVPADAVGLAEVLRDVWGGLMGTAAGENGVQSFPAAAVPANNVSIAEVLRDIWDAIRNGTGGTEPGTDKSVIDAIGYNGAAIITVGAGSLEGRSGAEFVVKKALTSSAILTTGVDVTGTASGGDIIIDDIIMVTDATGLAAGTNFTLEKNGGSGLLTFFSGAVSGLGANITQTLSDGSVTASEEEILASGQKIVAKCTGTNCTGSGVITLYLKCRRVAAGANLAAAA